jgi:translation initiation factor IF-2
MVRLYATLLFFVDLMHGLGNRQESLSMLRKKVPFVITLNKVDRLRLEDNEGCAHS